jgi:hypothetical protein
MRETDRYLGHPEILSPQAGDGNKRRLRAGKYFKEKD